MLGIGRGISLSSGPGVGMGPALSGGGCLPYDSIDGSVTAGQTFTHPADGVVAFTVTSLLNSYNDVHVRTLDSTHEWLVRFFNSGSLQLLEDNAGLTVRGGTTVTANDRVAVVLDGTTISVYINSVQKITYASASTASTATDGSYTTAGGTNPAISDLKTWWLSCSSEEGV